MGVILAHQSDNMNSVPDEDTISHPEEYLEGNDRMDRL